MPSFTKRLTERLTERLYNRTRPILLCCTVFLLSIGFYTSFNLQPGIAQSTLPTAPMADVVLDGRVLFKLGSIDGFTAERRASSANTDLYWALKTTPLDRLVRVNVAEQDNLTTIRVENRHLLTITDSDFMVGVTPEEQAQEWTELLQAAFKRSQKERLPSYRRAVIWRILAALTAAIALYILIYGFRRRLWRQRFRKLRRSKPIPYSQKLLQPALLGLQASTVLSFLLYVCELLPSARTARYKVFQFLEQTFNNALFTVGEKTYSVLDVSKLVLLLVLLWLAVRGLSALIKSSVLQAAISDRGAQDAIATLIQVVLMVVGTFILLQAWGIDLSALAILASVLGVGLGFGLQNIFNNFISGWILLVERPIQVGDLIRLGEVFGIVEKIGARSTEIKTPDQISIIVPNADFVQNQVMNWSHGHPVSRFHISLCVAYGSPIEQVHAAAIEAVQAHPEVLHYPKPRLRFVAFGESSLNFDLLAWNRDPLRQVEIKSDVHYLIEANFRRYQIEIPFPQRDINIRTTQLETVLPFKSEHKQQYRDQNNVFQHEPYQGPGRDERTHVIKDLMDQPVPSGIPASVMADVMNYSAILQEPQNKTSREIARLVEQMRGPEGLSIRDRKFRLTTYPSCFVGSEAVAWIAKTQRATHAEAIRLGQMLIELGIIHHVTDEHGFKDEYLFYSFYEPKTVVPE
ncbi:MAG: mechanosensitive ion channel domain-containing protein [Cyanobacteria bacterium J06621_11]